jgi:hypothetical protein
MIKFSCLLIFHEHRFSGSNGRFYLVWINKNSANIYSQTGLMKIHCLPSRVLWIQNEKSRLSDLNLERSSTGNSG